MKAIELPVKIGSKEKREISEIKITIPREKTVDWLVCLMALEKGHLESLTIKGAGQWRALEIKLITNNESQRVELSERRNTLTMDLSLASLEYVESFFLRSLLEGSASVDHIHIELSPKQPLFCSEGQRLDLIFATDMKVRRGFVVKDEEEAFKIIQNKKIN